MELQAYTIDFPESLWEELESLSFPGFEISQGKPFLRAQWLAIAQMALGRAVMIDNGRYGPEDEGDDDDLWISDLQEIGHTILDKFKPGDRQI